MTRLVAAVIALLILLLALYAFAQWQKRVSMFFPERYPIGEWTPRYTVAHTDESFTTSDGVRLHAWLFRAAHADAPVLIWFHGNAGNLTGRAPVAAGLAQHGITSFVFDYRGFGRSDGAPSERALFDDSLAAYDFVKTLFPRNQIILYGESLGGPYAGWVATKRKASCIVIENSFPSLSAMGNAMYHPVPLGYLVAGSLTTARWINQSELPTLVMHGKHDQVIPFELGKELFDTLRVPKEFFVSERAGHSEIPYAEGERYYSAITTFAAKHRGS